MNYKEFEQQVSRIVKILHGHGAEVTCDKRIPDPDNPSQLRQIDIEVIRDSKTIHIECRHHQAPQDVKWIEELMGRKESLGADCIIGVSSSGYTKGAERKATAKGIVLRDLCDIGDSDVFFWIGELEFTSSIFDMRGITLDFHVLDSKNPEKVFDEIRAFLNPNSILWKRFVKLLDELALANCLKSPLKSFHIYQSEFDINIDKHDDIQLDCVKTIHVTTVFIPREIKAKRCSQNSFREYNGDKIVVDAIVEGKKMPQWEIEVIQTSDRIGLQIKRDSVGLNENSYVASSIKIDHGDLPKNKTIFIDLQAPSLAHGTFSFRTRIINTDGEVNIL